MLGLPALSRHLPFCMPCLFDYEIHERFLSSVSRSRLIAFFTLVASTTAAAQAPNPADWGNLARYRAANDSLSPPKKGERRVVFIGDSITDSWAPFFPTLFPGKPYIGRGISGQTTPQILVRFRQDVVALQPRVVVILAGTNDIAGNTGPSTPEMILDNLRSMTEIAQANGIRVVLASVLPAKQFSWKKELQPSPIIQDLNAKIQRYARSAGAGYLDYYSPLADSLGGLKSELGKDSVHPNLAGYSVMAPLAEKAILKALKTPLKAR